MHEGNLLIIGRSLSKHKISYYYIQGLKQSLVEAKKLQKTENKKPFSMDCRERGSHAQGVYPTQDTSRMGTAGVKHEKKANIRITAK